VNLHETAGWYGVFAILAGYAANSLGYITAQNPAYQLLNLTGAVGLCTASYSKKDWPLFALNATWAVIAVYSLAKIYS